MDIREVSAEEKREYIDRVKGEFDYMRSVLATVEVDMESSELMIQASAVWIGGNLCTWFTDFMKQVKEIDQKQKTLNDIKQEIKETVNDNSNAPSAIKH